MLKKNVFATHIMDTKNNHLQQHPVLAALLAKHKDVTALQRAEYDIGQIHRCQFQAL